jgi:glycosyltransferase involved in cell wall biosynthesis
MKPNFIYWSPHPVHKIWADSIDAESTSFVPEKTLEFARKHPILHQLLSISKGFGKKSDINLIEGMQCILPAIMRGGKIVLINSDTFFIDLEQSKGLKRNLYLWYLKHVDAIISSSEMMKKLAEEYTDVVNYVVNPGINKKFFNIKCDLNSQDIAHGMSAIRLQKGSDIVIKVHQKRNKGFLYLIGPIADIEIPYDDKKIIYTGWTDNPELYLLTCGYYINPARFEPFGMNIVEAMAAGFAPIVSKDCGAAEIVRRIHPYLVIKNPTVNKILKRIKFLNYKHIRENLGYKAKCIATEYTEEKSIKKFKETWKKIKKDLGI